MFNNLKKIIDKPLTKKDKLNPTYISFSLHPKLYELLYVKKNIQELANFLDIYPTNKFYEDCRFSKAYIKNNNGDLPVKLLHNDEFIESLLQKIEHIIQMPYSYLFSFYKLAIKEYELYLIEFVFQMMVIKDKLCTKKESFSEFLAQKPNRVDELYYLHIASMHNYLNNFLNSNMKTPFEDYAKYLITIYIDVVSYSRILYCYLATITHIDDITLQQLICENLMNLFFDKECLNHTNPTKYSKNVLGINGHLKLLNILRTDHVIQLHNFYTTQRNDKIFPRYLRMMHSEKLITDHNESLFKEFLNQIIMLNKNWIITSNETDKYLQYSKELDLSENIQRYISKINSISKQFENGLVNGTQIMNLIQKNYY